MIILTQLVVSLLALCFVSAFLSGLRKKIQKQWVLRSMALGALVLASASLALSYPMFRAEAVFSVLSLSLGVMALIGITALHRFHSGSLDSKNKILQKLAYGAFALLLIHILLQAVLLRGT